MLWSPGHVRQMAIPVMAVRAMLQRSCRSRTQDKVSLPAQHAAGGSFLDQLARLVTTVAALKMHCSNTANWFATTEPATSGCEASPLVCASQSAVDWCTICHLWPKECRIMLKSAWTQTRSGRDGVDTTRPTLLSAAETMLKALMEINLSPSLCRPTARSTIKRG